MSTARFNRWQWSDGSNRNHIVQSVSVSSTAISTYNGPSGGAATGLGASSGFGSEPSSTSGAALVTTTFQPRYADSIILVQSTNVSVAEAANNGDDFRIFAHAGTYLIGWGYSGLTYGSFSSNLNAANMTLYAYNTSWGTDARTVRLGVDYTGGNNGVYINNRYVTEFAISPVTLTIMEIAV